MENKANQEPMMMVGTEQITLLYDILKKYKAGKHSTDLRCIRAEEWWKMHNDKELRHDGIEQPGEMKRGSGWLHNVITSKHADAIEAYPEPIFLPREEMDKEQAKMLSDIVPCVLEQNDFEETYSANALQKLKCGTGIYKVTWDKHKLNGLGDIRIERISPLNLFWEPGIEDIQDSRYVFETNLVDNEILLHKYPDKLSRKVLGTQFVASKFLYDDHVDTSEKSTVIDCYYHTWQGPKKILQYVQFVGDVVLYATENDRFQPTKDREIVNAETGESFTETVPDGVPMAVSGLYDHGLFPYVFDAMYKIEGSPCGYGYVDLGRDCQEQIDTMSKAICDNAVVAATPRYIFSGQAGINEDEFMDIRKPVVHSNGTINPNDYLQINGGGLSGNYIEFYNAKIEELRQVTGNTEVSTGTAGSSVTAASAIAALQEASGKGSRASTLGSYRAFHKVCNLVIELIRQFYTLPRTFRIIGEKNIERFVQFSNAGLMPQPQMVGGIDMGLRLPVFDIKIGAQKKNTYTKLAQNELALQFYQLGFFNPQQTDQSLMCIDMMDFDGKDEVYAKIQQMGTMYQQLLLYQQLALTLAMKYEPAMVQGLSQNIMQGLGQETVMANRQPVGMAAGDLMAEPTHMENARARSNAASQPDGGKNIAAEERR